jgi:hypothetical protein
MAWQWVVCTFIQDTDLSWTEAGHIRLDDGAPTHVGMEDLHHMADCPCSGKKPSIGHEMGRFSPPSNGKHLCRRIEIKMLHGLHMGIDGSSCNSKSVITIETNDGLRFKAVQGHSGDIGAYGGGSAVTLSDPPAAKLPAA